MALKKLSNEQRTAVATSAVGLLALCPPIGIAMLVGWAGHETYSLLSDDDKGLGKRAGTDDGSD